MNDAKSKKQTFRQELRGRFPVQLLRTENRHVPDCYRLSDLGSHIGYSTREFQALRLIGHDWPCGAGCRGLTTCLLYVCPLFGN